MSALAGANPSEIETLRRRKIPTIPQQTADLINSTAAEIQKSHGVTNNNQP